MNTSTTDHPRPSWHTLRGVLRSRQLPARIGPVRGTAQRHDPVVDLPAHDQDGGGAFDAVDPEDFRVGAALECAQRVRVVELAGPIPKRVACEYHPVFHGDDRGPGGLDEREQ